MARPTPVDAVPAYLRAGAAIPLNGRDPDVWSTPWPVAALDLPGRAGWLWAVPPTGATTARSVRAGHFTATVTPARQWLVDVATGDRELQIVAVTDAVPTSVVVNGVDVARVDGVEALRTRPAGWTTIGGTVGTVVVKVTDPSRPAPGQAPNEVLPATGAGTTSVAALALLAAAVLVRRLRHSLRRPPWPPGKAHA